MPDMHYSFTSSGSALGLSACFCSEPLIRTLRRFLFASALAFFSCSRCRFSWVFCLLAIGILLFPKLNLPCDLLDLGLKHRQGLVELSLTPSQETRLKISPVDR